MSELVQGPEGIQAVWPNREDEYKAEILRLRAENEKLRADTLEAAANIADVKARTVGKGCDEYSLACRHIAQELRAAAAAAYKETE